MSAFGRGTPAGNLIHNLYNKPSMPSTFDEDLARRLADARMKREAEARPKVKPIPKSQAHIKAPRMTGRRAAPYTEMVKLHPLPPHYGRKAAAQIEAEMAQDACQPIVFPDRKFISPADKQELQTWMEYDGDVPVIAPPPPRPPTPPPVVPMSKKKLFVEIVKEIDERKDFLTEMRSLGKAGEIEAKVKQEISQRLVELKKLDRLIKEEE
eukprot:NODE_1031_length_1151_cov_240.168784_g783_i0.p1 GENE.NODE_1031_length_1151_cov_240.168784_g783_i0~~NODE_1031_length_1151_cov_240.168784_g783_i0.p1  ORF type:complete len:210 (-),score=59.47 NODE_1031_length_1151_cov_240.168784_g783_i0:425-1054(-)